MRARSTRNLRSRAARASRPLALLDRCVPAQLVFEQREEIERLTARKANRTRIARNGDLVAAVELIDGASVRLERDALNFGIARQGDRRRVRDEERPREERVRQKRDHAEGGDVGRQNRPTRREQICSRAGRRRDDHAVGGELRRLRSVDVDSKRRHVSVRSPHDDIVERQIRSAVDACFEGAALVDDEAVVQHRGDLGNRTGSPVDLGQEAESPGVDAEQRDAARYGDLRSAQERAVASDRHQQHGFVDARTLGSERERNVLVVAQRDLIAGCEQRLGDRAGGGTRAIALHVDVERDRPDFGTHQFGAHAKSPATDARVASSTGFPVRSIRKNTSTLPAGPRSGERIAPTTTKSSFAIASRTSRTIVARTAGSRTTPPPPSRAGPASNCGLTSATIAPPGARNACARAIIVTTEMNDASIVTKSKGGASAPSGKSRKVVRSRTATRGSAAHWGASGP